MLLSNKNYLRLLFSIQLIIALASIIYTFSFSTKSTSFSADKILFDEQYPLPFTGRISLDAKIKFIKEHIDINKIDTLIVGSSIGLNNIQGAYLEKESTICNGVLNLSVYEASTLQVEKILDLIDAFPHLKRVVYSMQFSDFAHLSTFKTYDSKEIKKYITDTFNPIEEAKFIFNASKNIPFLLAREKEWKQKHGKNNKFTYLGFDSTGSVPLHIYGKDIIKKRWREPHAAVQRPKAFESLKRSILKVRKKNIYFYLIQQPYRKTLITKDINLQNLMAKLPSNLNQFVSKYGGIFFSLHERLDLEDKYFADRSHLNDKGSIITSLEIAKIIDKKESHDK